MKCIFDSSALIASFVQNHPKHLPSFEWLKKAKSKEINFYVTAHSILEIYHVLTSAPFKPRIQPEAAYKLIQANIKNDAQTLTLKSQDYYKIVNDARVKGFTGGIIYDMIVMECARKIGADKIITLNSKDFYRIKGEKDKIEIIAL